MVAGERLGGRVRWFLDAQQRRSGRVMGPQGALEAFAWGGWGGVHFRVRGRQGRLQVETRPGLELRLQEGCRVESARRPREECCGS